MAEEQDWRLMAEVEGPEEHHGPLDRVLGRVHDEYRKAADEAREGVPEGWRSPTTGTACSRTRTRRRALAAARERITAACEDHGLTATYVVSHWEDEFERWRQVDPPETAEQAQQTRAQDREGETVETQTVVCSAGKTVRDSLEQGMREYADRLGLECELVEHPHLLQTQVAFKVTGPRHKIAEFRAALDQDGWTSIRGDAFGTGLI